MMQKDRLIRTLHTHMEKLVILAANARDESAERALSRAKNVVPVLTGRLHASLKREGGKVFTRCPYARFVELGTMHCRPQPYLSAAADMLSYRRQAESAYREAIR